MDSQSHDIIVLRLDGYLESIRVIRLCTRVEGKLNDLCSLRSVRSNVLCRLNFCPLCGLLVCKL